MAKIIALTLLGVVLVTGSIYLLFLYIMSLNTNGNFLYLGLTLVLSGTGVFLLYRAGKSDRTVVSSMPPIKPLSDGVSENSGLAGRLKQNNELLGQWKKTNETKDRLRMLEIQAAEGASDNS